MMSTSSFSSLISEGTESLSSAEIQFYAQIKAETDRDIMEPELPDVYIEQLLQNDGQVTIAYSNFKIMPRNLPRILGSRAETLDLSYNRFKNLGFLVHFTKLHTLVLDHNTEMQMETFPRVPTLKFLWVNNCQITNIDKWTRMLSVNCPELEHLSMLCNPDSSSQLNGKSELEEKEYRYGISQILTKLKTLDGRPIEDIGERKTSLFGRLSTKSRSFLVSGWDSCSELAEHVKVG